MIFTTTRYEHTLATRSDETATPLAESWIPSSQSHLHINADADTFLSWGRSELFANTPSDGAPGSFFFETSGETSETPDTPSNTSTTASIAIGGTFVGATNTPTDTDWIRVELTAGESYLFTLTGTGASPLADPFLELRNSAGTLIAQDDDAGPGLNPSLRYTATTSGAYYLTARAYQDDDQPGTTGTYTLTADVGPPQNPVDAIAWGTSLSSTHVDVYFAPTGETYDGFTSVGWSTNEITQAMAALDTYANVTNLTFDRVFTVGEADFTLVTVASAEFGGRMGPPSTTNAGLGIFNTSRTGWGAGLTEGGAGFYLFLHEFGHGLGLAQIGRASCRERV